MFILDCNITIGNIRFKQVQDVRIVKSVDNLVDTAVIKLPASAMFGSRVTGYTTKQVAKQIRAGMPVSITLAYKDVFEKEEFKGFISFVKPNVPTVEIQCEDAVYLLRKKRINKNFKKTTLKQVLNYVVNGTSLELAGDIPEVQFDSFLIKNKNGAQTIQKLMDEYGLSIFVDDNGKLYAGLRQVKNSGKTVSYSFQHNVIKHNLTFRNAEDVRIYVKVIGVRKDNKKIEVIVGDTDGEQRTLHKYNVSSKAALKKIGLAHLEELKYTGYRGNLTAFLIPYATRGMSAEIIDSYYPERSGVYFIPKVTITFGTNGARRKVELGKRLK